MTKWEYKEDTFTSYQGEDFIDWLNLHGDQGWELIQEVVIPQFAPLYKYRCIFKRKI
jgi:hypothetical protein